MDQNLTFDRLFAIIPHPMYTIGYAFYYGSSIISRSYAVLYVSFFAHFCQMMFLVFVENPRILITNTQTLKLSIFPSEKVYFCFVLWNSTTWECGRPWQSTRYWKNIWRNGWLWRTKENQRISSRHRILPQRSHCIQKFQYISIIRHFHGVDSCLQPHFVFYQLESTFLCGVCSFFSNNTHFGTNVQMIITNWMNGADFVFVVSSKTSDCMAFDSQRCVGLYSLSTKSWSVLDTT